MRVQYVEKPAGFDVRMRVVQTITQPIGELSVAEICRRADISRQTFYSYFESKYAIGPWYASHCDTFTLDLIGRSLGWREAYEGWYTLLGKQRLLFENASKSRFNDEGERRIAEQRISAFQAAFKERGVDFTDEYRGFAHMCAVMERAAFHRWLKECYATPPHELARFTELCVPPLLHRALS
ncbi:TetR/AcrR family transcriptional regulator [Adlercreutzia sp. R21]|uniref:TetR/AcrR family transcriptional regulator n=1 Tax=Adlercreutzia wanghongyangiae TaxID=3111451 RepID=A0ABU6IJ40_9ACTN|nr:TetR/AcrR family transcriptional regulator [Adlercreutzia sp. R21]MEC4176478.1 TetR/AcrR family transcriptional regulator [Adlercreutzia sp. R7]MEC4184546.1 TetR/AcrR family transcriptional regulator [Adlercreutzia sp. R21]